MFFGFIVVFEEFSDVLMYIGCDRVSLIVILL